ncbi:protein FAM32A-like [Chrysoperla carnea]|uniref:protein FAM32A-like n=1 Tax=Chrysoperla carnea TaxID=189513 RepID=UPI001D06C139|nr:protein FAM32A-like [Chrysoperla carnea]
MSEDDPYAHVAKGPLKLKGDGGIKKKKKKKDKEKLEQAAKVVNNDEQKNNETVVVQKRTKAELAFLKMQEKMQNQRILEKASMTHKQRVEKFNQHLDSLTEHFDIPKVSWTK